MKIIEKVLDFLYPNTCCFCGKVCKDFICDSCKKQIEYVKEPVCKKCGKPIQHQEEEYCQDCLKGVHVFEQGKSVWIHKGNVRWSIYQFKYHNRRCYGECYAEEMCRCYGDKMKEWGIDVIMPVPLHRKRQRQRGYNQAEVLARLFGEKTGIFVDTKTVFRKRYTNPQKELAYSERKRNVHNAFFAKRLKKNMQNILIIDDIYTTGNTIDEMARCLYGKGAKKVFFLTISIGQGF